MTNEQLRFLAESMILDAAKDVDFLSIIEMAPDHMGDWDFEISDQDARRVSSLIDSAAVSVVFG